MTDATKTAPSIRELALAEIETVSGGLTQQERLALQRKLTQLYKEAHKDDISGTIHDHFHL